VTDDRQDIVEETVGGRERGAPSHADPGATGAGFGTAER
jgi:hypothetical protein